MIKPICHTIQAWLHEGHNTPSPALAAQFEDHLRLCLQCQGELAKARQLSSMLQGVASEVIPHIPAQALAARTIALAHKRRQKQRTQMQWFWVPVAACATICISVLSWQLMTVLPSLQTSPRTAPLSTAQQVQPRTAGTRQPRKTMLVQKKRIEKPSQRIQMTWPSDYVFVISKSRTRRQVPTRQRAPKPKKI